MTPIRQLLNRIRWDREFAKGQFELGYYDRVENRIILVPFTEVQFPEDDPRAFRIVDLEGRIQRVPYHRVREIYKDAQCIWRRPAPREMRR